MRLSAIMTDAERHAAYAENAELMAHKEQRQQEDRQRRLEKRSRITRRHEITQAEIAKINTEIDRVNEIYAAFDREHPEIAAESKRRWHDIQRNSVYMTDDELRAAVDGFDRWKAETYGVSYDAQIVGTLGSEDLASIRHSLPAVLAARDIAFGDGRGKLTKDAMSSVDRQTPERIIYETSTDRGMIERQVETSKFGMLNYDIGTMTPDTLQKIEAELKQLSTPIPSTVASITAAMRTR